MAGLNLSAGQLVTIPEVKLSDGSVFSGVVRAADGQTVVVELAQGATGGLAAQVNVEGELVWNDDSGERRAPISIRERIRNALVTRLRVDERREAPRLRVDMSVEYRIVPAEQADHVAEEVMARVNTLAEQPLETIQLLRTGDDPMANLREEIAALREMIGDLMQKVDDLTQAVRGGKPQTGAEMHQPLGIQNCSAGGIGIITSEAAEIGTKLRLRLTLRSVPAVTIDCMGEIARQDTLGAGERFEWGVRFTHIHEADRERLIHYLFKIQRRMLRDMKEAREAITGTD